MADLIVVSVTVDGNQLENPAAGYEIASYGSGRSNVRRQTVETDDVPGRLLVAWTRDQMLGELSVVVKGSTAAQLKTRVDTLTGWFDQADYTIAATFSDVGVVGNWTESWSCEPADWEIGDGGVLDNVLLGSSWQRVHFSWPHSPIAV